MPEKVNTADPVATVAAPSPGPPLRVAPAIRPRFATFGVPPGVLAEERGVPFKRRHEAERDLHQGRLARAVRPDERQEFARKQVERHVLEHLGLAEADADVVNVQGGRGHNARVYARRRP